MTEAPQLPTLGQAARLLAEGKTTSRRLVERCLEAVEADANARSAYLLIDADGARAEADRIDRQRRLGQSPGLFAGIPLSVKDLFDVEGQVTTAGSRVLRDSPTATADAPALARLRAAGFVMLGRTHMTEFAYSGLGLNIHHPEPHSIWYEEEDRAPGGSSSGAAISVATGGALAAIGTDTGGSCRIPAALNGLVGFKPTASRIPRDGLIPLSPSMDSVGPIGRSVACCDILDRFMSGHHRALAEQRSTRLLVPTNLVWDNADGAVVDAVEEALDRLQRAGIRIVRARVDALDRVPTLGANGGIVAIEAFRFHRPLVDRASAGYDPRVLRRVRLGEGVSDERYVELLELRAAFIEELGQQLAGYDAMVMPTVPIPPPRKSDCMDEDGYTRHNALVLRNPSIANHLDGCSITLPLHGARVPAGLMAIAGHGQDDCLLALATRMEAHL